MRTVHLKKTRKKKPRNTVCVTAQRLCDQTFNMVRATQLDVQEEGFPVRHQGINLVRVKETILSAGLLDGRVFRPS